MYLVSSKLNKKKEDNSNLTSSNKSNCKENTLSKKKNKISINKISQLYYKQSQSKSKSKSKKKSTIKQPKKTHYKNEEQLCKNQYYIQSKKVKRQIPNAYYDEANPLYYHNTTCNQMRKDPNQKLIQEKKVQNQTTFKNKNIIQLLKKKKLLCQNDGISDSEVKINKTLSKHKNHVSQRSIQKNNISSFKSMTNFNFSNTFHDNVSQKTEKKHSQFDTKNNQKQSKSKSKLKTQKIKCISNKQHKSAYTQRHQRKKQSKTNKSDQNQENRTIQENDCEQMSFQSNQEKMDYNYLNFHKSSVQKIGKNLQKQLKLQEEQQKIIYPKTLLTNQFLISRAQSISLMSKICEKMMLTKETHSLAINYLDFYLAKELDYQSVISIKVIAITSLLIAAKIDNTQMVKNICTQLMDHPQILSIEQLKIETPSTLKSFASTQRKNKKKSVIKQGPQQQITQIMQMEMEMIMKLNFQLNIKTHIYWINTLVFVWDKFIKQKQFQTHIVSNQQLLLFNITDDRHKKLTVLFQIVQMSKCNPRIHEFNKSFYILSLIYLLIRIQIQVYQFGSDFQTLMLQFKNSLQKSTNMVFYDKVGVNQIFGKYMSPFNVNLSSLISSIQFGSQFLLYSTIRYFFSLKEQKYKGRKKHQNQIGNTQKQQKKSGIKTKEQQSKQEGQKYSSKSSLLKYSNIKQNQKMDKIPSIVQTQSNKNLYVYNSKIYQHYSKSLQSQRK